MKRSFLVVGLVLSVFFANAQIFHPVKWSYASKKISKTETLIFLKAEIEEPWHIYSAYQEDGGPVKTSFNFETSKDFELSGKITEPKPVTVFEKSFGINVNYFTSSVIFQQKIKLNRAKNVVVKGWVKFMCCNDKQCLPPETQSFIIPIK